MLFAIAAVSFLAVIIYQRSWVPAYAEAEPLQPTIVEFGRVFVESASGETISAERIQATLQDDRFRAIQRYGIVFSSNPEILTTIRINHIFSFDIASNGTVRWNDRSKQVGDD